MSITTKEDIPPVIGYKIQEICRTYDLADFIFKTKRSSRSLAWQYLDSSEQSWFYDGGAYWHNIDDRTLFLEPVTHDKNFLSMYPTPGQFWFLVLMPVAEEEREDEEEKELLVELYEIYEEE